MAIVFASTHFRPDAGQGAYTKTRHIANSRYQAAPFTFSAPSPSFGLSYQSRKLCSSGRPLLWSRPGRRHFRLPQQQGSRRQFPTRQSNRRCVSLVPGEGGAEMGCGRQRCKRAVSYCCLPCDRSFSCTFSTANSPSFSLHTPCG